MLVIKAVLCLSSFGLLTGCDNLLRQPFYMDTLLEVLPDMQTCGSRVEQVCDDLLVDFKEAALAQEANLPAFPLRHHTHRPCSQQTSLTPPQQTVQVYHSMVHSRASHKVGSS